MIRRPPRSTLFPNPTLCGSVVGNDQQERVPPPAPGHRPAHEVVRSEEHTSELQSRLHLVCRLLLEKKGVELERAVAGLGGDAGIADVVLGDPHGVVGPARVAADGHDRRAGRQLFLDLLDDTATAEIYTLSLHVALPI